MPVAPVIVPALPPGCHAPPKGRTVSNCNQHLTWLTRRKVISHTQARRVDADQEVQDFHHTYWNLPGQDDSAYITHTPCLIFCSVWLCTSRRCGPGSRSLIHGPHAEGGPLSEYKCNTSWRIYVGTSKVLNLQTFKLLCNKSLDLRVWIYVFEQSEKQTVDTLCETTSVRQIVRPVIKHSVKQFL